MQKNKISKYLLETDILIDYLTFNNIGSEPFLLNLMQKGICFTSVLNASELFMTAKMKSKKKRLEIY
jgi:hypothetical protein